MTFANPDRDDGNGGPDNTAPVTPRDVYSGNDGYLHKNRTGESSREVLCSPLFDFEEAERNARFSMMKW